MTSTKRSAATDFLVEAEMAKLCSRVKCDVCVVPLNTMEMSTKHYASKIHAKKVERWKESFLAMKKMKMMYTDEVSVESEEATSAINSDAYKEKDKEYKVENDNSNKTEDYKLKEVYEGTVPAMSMPLDPKLIDSLDPSTMKKMLSGKPTSRWDTPVDNIDGDGGAVDDSLDDPDDPSIPIDSNKLLKKCFNPVTGIGYCQYCNKLLRSEQEAKKHFSLAKHAGKVLTYQELLLSEAAVLAGTAAAAPPPHRGHYCELCESDCSGQVQLDQHLRGERHRTNVRKMERELAGDPELDKDINPYNLPEVWLRERKHCNLCDVPIFSIRMAKIHFNSKNHRVAAGLNISRASRENHFVSSGKFQCDVCNFKTSTEIDMKVHTAGIRHLENERTKAAVESNGGEWKVGNPSQPDPPKFSVQAPPADMSMQMMGWGGGGWGWGGPMMPPPYAMGMRMIPPMMGQSAYPPMGMYPPNLGSGNGSPMNCSICKVKNETQEQLENHLQSEEHKMAEANSENFRCKLCSSSFISSQDLAQHQTGPTHARNVELKMERDRLRQAGHDLPDSDQEEGGQEEEEDVLPEPLPENPSSSRTKSNPFHCPFCKVWVPTVTLLRFYHRRSFYSHHL